MARETWHGKLSGYAVYRCRCAECRRALRESMRAYRQRPAVKAKRRAYLRAYHAELRRLVKLAKQMEAQHGESPSA